MRKKVKKFDISWKLYSLLLFFIISISMLGFGLAYHSGLAPSIAGHDANEIEVEVDGEVMSLQEYIVMNGDIVGSISSQWDRDMSDGDLYYMDGMIGIGVEEPESVLDVDGNMSVSDYIIVNGQNVATESYVSSRRKTALYKGNTAGCENECKGTCGTSLTISSTCTCGTDYHGGDDDGCRGSKTNTNILLGYLIS